MDFYHANFSKVQRSKGQNAIATAAYCGGMCLQKLSGEIADYRKKKNVCGHKIIIPSHFSNSTPPDTQWVWAEAEKAENRKNSTTARRGDLALPREFTQEESFAVGYAFVQDLVDRYGVIAQVDFHNLNGKNPHIDLMWTTRLFDGEKFLKKTRELDDKVTGPQEIKWLREKWANRVNEVLAKYGKSIDHRSYKDQGSEKLATRHLGRKATALERKGIKTEIGKYNDKVREHNKLIEKKEQLNKDITLLEMQLKENNYDILEQEKSSRICGSKREHADLGAKTHQLGGEGSSDSASVARSGNNGNQDHFQQEPRTTGDKVDLLNDRDGANQGKQEINSTVGQLGGITQYIERTTETKSSDLRSYPSNQENIGCVLSGNSQSKAGLSEFQQHIQSLLRLTRGCSKAPARTNGEVRYSYHRNVQACYGYIQSIKRFIEWRSKAASRNSGHRDGATSNNEQAFRQVGKIYEIMKQPTATPINIDVSKVANIHNLIQDIATKATLSAISQNIETRKIWSSVNNATLATPPIHIEHGQKVRELVAQIAAQATMQEITKNLQRRNELASILAKPLVTHSQSNLPMAKEISKIMKDIATDTTLTAIYQHVEAKKAWAFMDNTTLAPLPPILKEYEQGISETILELADHATAKGIRKILHKARYEQRVAYHQDKIRAQLEAMQQAIEQPTITLLDEVTTPPQQDTIKIEQKSYKPSNHMENSHDREYNNDSFKPR